MSTTQMHMIPISKIEPSATNQRLSMDAAALAELTESVREHGVLSPILVRRTHPGSDRYELVAGHRRLAAARAAGLLDVPASVRDLTDPEALEVQVVENLQRSDLHPLEEAEGYLELHEVHGHSVEMLAAKVGKSRGYVYGRMQLAKLPQAAKDVFWKGEMNASLALLIARIPDTQLQERAAKAIIAGRSAYVGGKMVEIPMTLREASEYVQRNFMLALKTAPFDTTDEELVADHGACTTCPLRTGNAVDLFGDVKDVDLCTCPPCFELKRSAAWDLEAAVAIERGHTVLNLKASGKVFDKYDPARLANGWVKPTQKIPDDRKGRTYAQLVKEKAADVKTFAARHPISGKAVVVWKRDEVAALLAGKNGKATNTSAPLAESGDERDWELEREIQRETEAGMLEALVVKCEGLDPHEFHSYLVGACQEWAIARALKRRGHADIDSRTAPLDPLVAELSPEQMQGLVAELVIEADDDTMKAFGLSREIKGIKKAAKARVLAARKAAAATLPAPESSSTPETSKRAKKGGAR